MKTENVTKRDFRWLLGCALHAVETTYGEKSVRRKEMIDLHERLGRATGVFDDEDSAFDDEFISIGEQTNCDKGGKRP